MAIIHNKKHTGREWMYKLLIFIVTVFLIVYFLPRDNEFNYRFDISKPWRYEPLIATFDFPVYKSEATVKREQDSIMASFCPYYRYNRNVEKEAFDSMEANYDLLKSLFPSSEYITYIKIRLKAVYGAGVVSTEDMENLQKDNAASIRVTEGKRLTHKATDRLFTVKKAYEYVLSPDSTFRYSEHILRKYPLGEYLSPNLIFDEPHTTAAKNELLKNYSLTNGTVQSGQKIIDRGEIVDGQTYEVLESLRTAF
ncbi:hypothetical protein EZS27_024840, partial [termite gut metagenome]